MDAMDLMRTSVALRRLTTITPFVLLSFTLKQIDKPPDRLAIHVTKPHDKNVTHICL